MFKLGALESIILPFVEAKNDAITKFPSLITFHWRRLGVGKDQLPRLSYVGHRGLCETYFSKVKLDKVSGQFLRHEHELFMQAQLVGRLMKQESTLV